MAGLVPAIHVFSAKAASKTWMPAPKAGHDERGSAYTPIAPMIAPISASTTSQ